MEYIKGRKNVTIKNKRISNMIYGYVIKLNTKEKSQEMKVYYAGGD